MIAAAYRMLLAATLPPRLAVQYCCQAAITVLILAVLVPPFEGSDEFNHFNRADEISAGGLVATRYGGPRTSGGVVDSGINRVDAIIGSVRFHPERKVTQPMMAAAHALQWGKRGPATFANTAIYAPVLYAPAVVGIWAGRGLGMSVTQTLVIARAANGLVCVAIAGAAIALAGEAATFLFVASSLPMSVFLFQAVSQDGLMVALAALATALVSRMHLADLRARRWYLAGLVGCLALLAMGRPAYLAFAVLPLLVEVEDASKDFFSGKKWQKTSGWLSLFLPGMGFPRLCGLVGVILPVAAWTYLTARLTFFNAEDFRDVDPARQLAGLVADPARLWTLARSIAAGAQGMEGSSFYRETIGILGWLDVILPGWFYTFAGGALAAALVVSLARARPMLPAWSQGSLFLAASAAIALVFLLEYLSWTPVGWPIVQGVQGRYFLPVLMFLPAMLPAVRSVRFALLCGPVRVLILAFPAVSVVVTVSSVVRRYYL